MRSCIQGNVEYVAVRAGLDECATPAKLVQNYVVCRLDKKMDVLLGFIKTHLKSKMIVFFTSCAQVCVFTAQPTSVCVSTGVVSQFSLLCGTSSGFGSIAHSSAYGVTLC